MLQVLMTLRVLVNAKPWPVCKAFLPVNCGGEGICGWFLHLPCLVFARTRKVTEHWDVLVLPAVVVQGRCALLSWRVFSPLDAQKMSSGARRAEGVRPSHISP